MEKDSFVKRAELLLHTKLSDDVSIIGVKEIFEKAEEFSLHTVAFTDFNSVQSYPEIAKLAKKYSEKIKVIYGAQVCIAAESAECDYHRLTLLCKNQAGLKELYRVVSSLKDDGGCYVIDTEVLSKNRSNLLVGCDCTKTENIPVACDYCEIYPFADEDKKAEYKAIYAKCKEKNIPLVAVCNARCLVPKDAICCEVLRLYKGLEPKENTSNLLGLDEMFSEFAYLGEYGAKDVVLSAPEKIAAMVEDVQPLSRERSFPVFDNAHEILREKVYEKAYKIYGNPLPEAVRERIEKELGVIPCDEIATSYLITDKLSAFAREKGGLASSRGIAGSVLLSWVLGISNANPLPAYYYCEKCHYFELADTQHSGFALPKKDCPVCSQKMKSDGNNIPCETFMGLAGEKTPLFQIVVPDTLEDEVADYLREIMGKENVLSSGVVSKHFERFADMRVAYYEKYNGLFDEPEREEIVRKICGTKRSESNLAYSFVLKSSEAEFEDYTPVRGSEATHIDFHDLYDSLLKIDIIRHSDLSALYELQKKTGVNIENIDLSDKEIYKVLYSDDTSKIPVFCNEFIKSLAEIIKPENFSDVLKIIGFGHSTNMWKGNAELLYPGTPLEKIPATRDDVFLDLCKVTDRESAYKYSEAVRKGMIERGKLCKADLDKFKEITKELGEWYFDFCSKVMYAFPKAHAVEYALIVLYFAWFRCYYPKEFEDVVSDTDKD